MQLKQRNQIPADQKESYDSVALGATLYGYCCGYFGRDSYNDKVVVEKTFEHLVVREKGYIHTSRRITD